MVVRATGLVKRFGPRTVLDGVSLSLQEGDAVLVRGRSGSGKSTLLHLLAGLATPTAGQVELGGRDLAALEEGPRAELRLRMVGLVFQDFNLIPDLTADENVRVPLLLAGRREGARERSATLLQRLGVGHLARSFPASLSGGEMQRVAIARALANDPKLILADEPTANLDETNSRVALELLAQLAREGRAVLVASHDPLATQFFARRVELRGGKMAPALRDEAFPERAREAR